MPGDATLRAVAGPAQQAASEQRLEYSPRPDATSETEARALAAVYAYILFGRCEPKEVPTEAGNDNRTETKRAKEPSGAPSVGEGSA